MTGRNYSAAQTKLDSVQGSAKTRKKAENTN